MPVRIKPVHFLRPCVLDLSSIKGICKLVDKNFNVARYAAEDGVWEVYDEISVNFLDAITVTEDTSGTPKHKTLDSFIVTGKQQISIESDGSNVERTEREIHIIFDKSQAVVKFSGSQELENWFKHFMRDLQEHLRSPSFRQRINTGTDDWDRSPLSYPALVRTVPGIKGFLADKLIEASKAPYCQIVLYKHPPNVMVENIKAGLITNFLWVPIVFIAGFAVAVLAYWIWNRYNINVYDFLSPPSIPTATPSS